MILCIEEAIIFLKVKLSLILLEIFVCLQIKSVILFFSEFPSSESIATAASRSPVEIDSKVRKIIIIVSVVAAVIIVFLVITILVCCRKARLAQRAKYKNVKRVIIMRPVSQILVCYMFRSEEF